MQEEQIDKGNFFKLTPFLVFVGLFLFFTIWFKSKVSPLFPCLIAIIFSFFTFPRRFGFNEKVKVFLSGSSQSTILAMSYIFIFSSVFTYVLRFIGGIDSAVKLGFYLMPDKYILPGFFLVVAFFAIAIGSSMGTIAAFLPIGLGIATKMGVSPALMAGIVVSGSMLGDNLSIISDTTIAATQTTGTKMVDKFKANVRLVLVAALLTVAVLTYLNFGFDMSGISILMEKFSFLDMVVVAPYLLIFFLALLGLDVIAVLVSGTLVGIGIGLFIGKFSLLEGTSFLLEGFSRDKNIHEVLLLALMIAGLSKIVEFNGGLKYLLKKLGSGIKSKAGAEVSISMFIFFINAIVAINTVAILVAGPIASQIGEKFNIEKKRVACLLDIFSCICQGILPYAPQLLLARSLANISSVSIIPFLYYQGFIFIVTVFSIIRTFLKEKKDIVV